MVSYVIINPSGGGAILLNETTSELLELVKALVKTSGKLVFAMLELIGLIAFLVMEIKTIFQLL